MSSLVNFLEIDGLKEKNWQQILIESYYLPKERLFSDLYPKSVVYLKENNRFKVYRQLDFYSSYFERACVQDQIIPKISLREGREMLYVDDMDAAAHRDEFDYRRESIENDSRLIKIFWTCEIVNYSRGASNNGAFISEYIDFEFKHYEIGSYV